MTRDEVHRARQASFLALKDGGYLPPTRLGRAADKVHDKIVRGKKITHGEEEILYGATRRKLTYQNQARARSAGARAKAAAKLG